MKRCCQCRDGEHPNYDDDVLMTTVRDPSTGQLRCRGYLCAEHREMFAEDDYVVTSPKGRTRKWTPFRDPE